MLGLAAGTFVCLASADQTGTPTPCNNPVPPTPPPSKCPPEGVNPVNVANGDVQREIRDLEVFGGVGEHQLNFTRYGHSRLADGARWFGDGHLWRHSYQWEMVSVSNNLQFTYPDGTVHVYKLSGGNWTRAADNPDLLTQSGNNFYLRLESGFTYHFAKLTSGSASYYQLQDFSDSFGNPYALTYDANNRLVLVTEPAGRWLRINYTTVSVNQTQWTQFYAQATEPPSGWNTVTVNNPAAYRYLRYFSSEPGATPSSSIIAEVQFYDTAGNLITGTPFGSTPSFQNSSSTFDKAFDGNTSTYFRSASVHYGFTGIDLGAGNAKAVGKIKFFPRAGYEHYMKGANQDGLPTGCRFEGSNAAPVIETVIASVEAGYGSGGSLVLTRTVQYNYTAMPDPVLACGWLVLSAASYGDGSQASYSYQSLFAGQRPLLASADDPRMKGAATKIKYEFWADGSVYGSIYAEHDFASNQILAKFEGNGTTTGRKVTYASGAVHRTTIVSNGNVAVFTNAMGHTTNYAYLTAGAGFLQGETDQLGQTTSYTRDAQGRVLSVTYADNASESWTRDALGHALTHTNARGYTTSWTRDASGRATRIDYPDGGYETFTYNSFGKVLTHRQTNGGTESFAYDGRGMETGWTDALNHRTDYTYDANDLLVSVTDPLNHSTVFAHNERGQITKATYADSTSTSYGYDAYGDRLSTTNELGKTWSGTFDAYKRKITSTDPLNRTTQYWYDEPGAGSGGGCGGCGSGLGGTGNHISTIILPSGKTIKMSYDLAWRKTGQTVGYNTAAAATTGYGYDAANNLTSMTDGRGKTTAYVYDSRNRRISATDPLGHASHWTFDAAGNSLSETRAGNGVTAYTYDSMDRRTQMTDPLSQITLMAYDAAGNLITLTDARSNAYGFTYDLRNRNLSTLYPGGGHEDRTYDVGGNVASYTARAGQVETFSYDNRNRQTLEDWNDATPDVSHTYDGAGRLLTLNNSASALTYTYDSANELLTETQDIADGPGAQTLTYTYDPDGNRASLLYPDGHTVGYGYTTRNEMSSVTADGSLPVANFTYDLAGNRSAKTLENGTSATYTYDDANRLTSIVDQAGGTTFATFSYGYNDVNNRTSVTRETGLGNAYTYDSTDQLTGTQYDAGTPGGTPSSPSKTQGFAYDGVGNRTSASEGGVATSYSNDLLNQYVNVGSVAETHDANGNLLTGILPTFACTYDASNRLTYSVYYDGANTMATNLYYDARGRCVRRMMDKKPGPVSGGIVPHVTTTSALLYDQWSLIEELQKNGANPYVELARYVHGSVVDEILVKVDSSGPGYYHQDALISTTHLTSSTGAVVESYKYDAFGLPSVFDGSGSLLSGGTAQGNRFLFTGREWMADLKWYDYRNRAYSPLLGRFLQADPMRFDANDVNLYRYCFNAPATMVDHYGLLGSGSGNTGPCDCANAGGTYEPRWQAINSASASDCADKLSKPTKCSSGLTTATTVGGVIVRCVGGPSWIGAGLSIPGAWNAGNWFGAYLDCLGYTCVGATLPIDIPPQ